MFDNVPNVHVDEITQNNAQNIHSGQSSITVQGGAQYLSSVRINAKHVHSAVDDSIRLEALKDKLYTKVAVGALHNSAERCDAPKCHEQTRIAVQGEIFSWITNGDRDAQPTRLLWVTGPAGTGKTAIMGSVADTCQKDGLLAATFFFSSFSGSPHRRLKRRLITTLAYQLQQHPILVHTVGKRILNAVGADPGYFDKILKNQMTELILKPLQHCQGRLGDPGSLVPRVIIIDGLDECEVDQYQEPTQSKQKIPRTKEGDQEEILSILFEAIEDPAFPFRVIIASRPERHIRRFFSDKWNHLSRATARELFLDEKYNPDADVGLFLRSKFSQIRRQHEHLLPTWPGEDVIGLLVKNASGQFVYAATVIAFVQTPSSPPQVQLEYILKLRHRANANPLQILDALYTAIIESCPNPSLTFQWLQGYRQLSLQVRQSKEALWLGPAKRQEEDLSAWFFSRLSESLAGEGDVAVGNLVSLIRFPPTDRLELPYVFYHRSFLDFLDDQTRSRVLRAATPFKGTKPWLMERISRVLMCQGPEVPLALDTPGQNQYFVAQFFQLWDLIVSNPQWSSLFLRHQQLFCQCDVRWWIGNLRLGAPPSVQQHLWFRVFRLVHVKCRWNKACTPLCKHWRDPILLHSSAVDSTSKLNLLLDRFCLRRIKQATK